ncbi:LPXTG-site transpeptidase (sortase) family protein [Kribbella antiqua]|uniref:LPXTG-site transpeptidase (Sortase) family protein n=1 Tax=Kribbella antiqua TaxID=2512217 RepID=A0A4V2S4Z4_9ACTN|nr:LPXTG-site transpeptidase (sortase) family protein [Kribbella antiqua]
MGRSRHVHRDHLTSSVRGQVIAAAGFALALLAAWVIFAQPAGDEAAQPSKTNAPTTRPQTSPTTSPVVPSAAPTPTRSDNAGQGSPKRILLPQIAVSAQVIPIAADGGILTPPSNPRAVGWWSAGAQPGARIGSAVMTAHTVHTGGGAFDDLDKLRPGALVTVITSTGRITYVVTSMTNYPKQSLAKHATELFDQTTSGRLVLVTCEDWNGKVYLSNAVALAEPVR